MSPTSRSALKGSASPSVGRRLTRKAPARWSRSAGARSPAKEWLAAASIVEGPVFRQVGKGGRLLPGRLSPQNVALIVKAYAKRLGLDPGAFSGHSLRAGFLTSAAARGASLFKMMDVSRHKSVDTLRGYVRDADAFRDHAGAGLL
jgi:integrase